MPSRKKKKHENRLHDVRIFCRVKAGKRKLTDRKKEYIRKNCLPSFDQFESILPKAVCDRCRVILNDVLKNEESNRKLPENNFQEMLQELQNLPPETRNSSCNCFCCIVSKTHSPSSKVMGRPSPHKKEGIVK